MPLQRTKAGAGIQTQGKGWTQIWIQQKGDLSMRSWINPEFFLDPSRGALKYPAILCNMTAAVRKRPGEEIYKTSFYFDVKIKERLTQTVSVEVQLPGGLNREQYRHATISALYQAYRQVHKLFFADKKPELGSSAELAHKMVVQIRGHYETYRSQQRLRGVRPVPKTGWDVKWKKTKGPYTITTNIDPAFFKDPVTGVVNEPDVMCRMTADITTVKRAPSVLLQLDLEMGLPNRGRKQKIQIDLRVPAGMGRKAFEEQVLTAVFQAYRQASRLLIEKAVGVPDQQVLKAIRSPRDLITARLISANRLPQLYTRYSTILGIPKEARR